MHYSSAKNAVAFFNKYLKPGDRLLDVGSKMCDWQIFTYAQIIPDTVEYQGLDIEPGRSVDIVVKDPYRWAEVSSDSFDVIIAGQVLEHAEFFWLVFEEMVRVLKPGGYMCVISPKLQKTHRFPVDCWRFLPDGMKALAKYTGIKCISATASHESYVEIPKTPNDCVGVFQK